MTKWVVIALTVSVAFCAALDYLSRNRLDDSNGQIAAKRAEVTRLQSLVNEVTAYQIKKDALQKRIEMINLLKQRQRGAGAALAKLGDVDPNGVDSIAVVGTNLVVNRR